MTTKNVVVLDENMKTSVGRDNNVDDPPPNTAVLAIISFLPTIHLFRLHLNFLFDSKKNTGGEIWFKRGLTPCLTCNSLSLFDKRCLSMKFVCQSNPHLALALEGRHCAGASLPGDNITL